MSNQNASSQQNGQQQKPAGATAVGPPAPSPKVRPVELLSREGIPYGAKTVTRITLATGKPAKTSEGTCEGMWWHPAGVLVQQGSELSVIPSHAIGRVVVVAE